MMAVSLLCWQGHLHTYRYCDGVWIFNLTDATFRNEEMTQNIGKVKIVACDASLMKPEVPPQQ
jgi:transcription initiation factor TFIIA small subunit